MARGMIIDDSKFMRMIIKDTLIEGGHRIVAEADNGNDAVTLYEKERPDFVTMDITMGGIDGIRAASEIKSLDPESKIVVVSALSEKALKLRKENINVDAFVTKPFSKDKLLKKIKEIL